MIPRIPYFLPKKRFSKNSNPSILSPTLTHYKSMTPTARAQYATYHILHDTMERRSTEYTRYHVPKMAKALLEVAQGLEGRCIILNTRNHDGLPIKELSKQFSLTLLSPTRQHYPTVQLDFTCIFDTLSQQLETLSQRPLKEFLRQADRKSGPTRMRR